MGHPAAGGVLVAAADAGEPAAGQIVLSAANDRVFTLRCVAVTAAHRGVEPTRRVDRTTADCGPGERRRVDVAAADGRVRPAGAVGIPAAHRAVRAADRVGAGRGTTPADRRPVDAGGDGVTAVATHQVGTDRLRLQPQGALVVDLQFQRLAVGGAQEVRTRRRAGVAGQVPTAAAPGAGLSPMTGGQLDVEDVHIAVVIHVAGGVVEGASGAGVSRRSFHYVLGAGQPHHHRQRNKRHNQYTHH